ncbi:DUF6950 family protein [Sphingomonas sp. 3-13AW]|uniref:DUF6950 family protein n=1 Tax=Sphingomonas sp. 3-13AW TaxID=3050450 RepID=UPI003BB49D40
MQIDAGASAPLVVLRDAAQATLDRFVDVPFAWGKADCGKMLAFHLRQLGHELRLAKLGSYKTAIGATRALRRMGVASLAEALDQRYPRIAPAEAIVGDVISLPSTGKLDAIGICVGNGRALAFHESVAGAVVVDPLEVLASWRVYGGLW